MNGDFAHGTIAFTADLPQEAIDKVLANTKEDMDKWLESRNTFDLSDGADRTVAYISFPKGTKPEEVVQVVRCGRCEYYSNEMNCCSYVNGLQNVTKTDYCSYGRCADGERKDGEHDN